MAYMRYLHSEIVVQYGKTGLWRTEGAVLTREGKQVPEADWSLEE